MNRLSAILGIIILSSALSSRGEDLIIECRAEGVNSEKYKDQGGWLNSNKPPEGAKSAAPGLTPQGQCGSRKLVLGKEGSARFSPGFSSSGHYYVYITWPRAASATPVNIVIKHAKGTTTNAMSQDGFGLSGDLNSSKWNPLGDFDFAAGDDQYVEIQVPANARAITDAALGQAFADAVRFTSEPLSGTESAAASVPTRQSPRASAAGASSEKPAPAASTSAAAQYGLPEMTTSPPASSSDFKWYTSIPEAQQAAAVGEKKIFMYFFSDNDYTRHYDTVVLTDPSVKALLSSEYIMLKLDLAKDFDLAGKLGVYRGGTINIYDQAGQPLGQLLDKLQPQQVISALKMLTGKP